MAINETERIIYVYRMNTSELLSFSYEGTFLNKHSLQLPKKGAWSFYYLKDKFYFYYCIDADNESQPYMYAITDTMGICYLPSEMRVYISLLEVILVFRLIIWGFTMILCWFGANIAIRSIESQKKEKKLLPYGVSGIND